MYLESSVDYLYHYYEKQTGPFKNLSDLPIDMAQKILDQIKAENKSFAAKRYEGYLPRRRELERIAREIFISKGGKPKRIAPQYMVVGECNWLKTWYKEGCFLKKHISEFSEDEISFSYGDLFPTFSQTYIDNKEYRRQVYTYEEIKVIISRYGLPQEWNADGRHGPERYIEVQIWSNIC